MPVLKYFVLVVVPDGGIGAFELYINTCRMRRTQTLKEEVDRCYTLRLVD